MHTFVLIIMVGAQITSVPGYTSASLCQEAAFEYSAGAKNWVKAIDTSQMVAFCIPGPLR